MPYVWERHVWYSQDAENSFQWVSWVRSLLRMRGKRIWLRLWFVSKYRTKQHLFHLHHNRKSSFKLLSGIRANFSSKISNTMFVTIWKMTEPRSLFKISETQLKLSVKANWFLWRTISRLVDKPSPSLLCLKLQIFLRILFSNHATLCMWNTQISSLSQSIKRSIIWRIHTTN